MRVAARASRPQRPLVTRASASPPAPATVVRRTKPHQRDMALADERFTVSLLPARATKTVYFVRHGEVRAAAATAWAAAFAARLA
jgi:hypothetical protein